MLDSDGQTALDFALENGLEGLFSGYLNAVPQLLYAGVPAPFMTSWLKRSVGLVLYIAMMICPVIAVVVIAQPDLMELVSIVSTGLFTVQMVGYKINMLPMALTVNQAIDVFLWYWGLTFIALLVVDLYFQMYPFCSLLSQAVGPTLHSENAKHLLISAVDSQDKLQIRFAGFISKANLEQRLTLR